MFFIIRASFPAYRISINSFVFADVLSATLMIILWSRKISLLFVASFTT